MKKLVLSLVMFMSLATMHVQAQLRKIPAVVTDALKNKFPSAESVEWKDKVSVFEASFSVGEKKYQTSFNSKGEWQSTEEYLNEADLPAEVKDGFAKSKYTDWKTNSVAWIESKKDQLYRIYVEKSTLNKKYLYFTKTGQLKREAITL